MLWTNQKKYQPYPFDKESSLEDAILQVEQDLFGPSRIYLDIKKKIGAKGKTNNIPDGYLIDLSSSKTPSLFVVENELAKHDPLKHIAVQILQFSLSVESDPHKVKTIIKDALVAQNSKWQQCEEFVQKNGFENVDYLLEQMIFAPNSFQALVIIDELVEELEKILVSRFKFPVEVITLERFRAGKELAYQFTPFLNDITPEAEASGASLDPAEIDTVVVPAREEGFNRVFLGEHQWWAIRLHSSMIPKIKHIAAYQVKPVSAITHVGPVDRIEPWKDTGKYIVYLAEPARELKPIALVPKGRVRALQGLRYTSLDRLLTAENLDQVF